MAHLGIMGSLSDQLSDYYIPTLVNRGTNQPTHGSDLVVAEIQDLQGKQLRQTWKHKIQLNPSKLNPL